MLSPDNRALYSQALEAPEGYVFDSGVATTYTLDLHALLLLPFSLATRHAADAYALLNDPAVLLDSVRSISQRLAVFHHEGGISLPQRPHLLFGLMEDSVFAARSATQGAAFHPKLWLLRFVSEDTSETLLRAVVLSRNLTFDRAWDTVLCLEGVPRRARVDESKPLAALVASLPTLATREVDAARADLIAELAELAGRTQFTAPEPFDRYTPRFHAPGIAGATFQPKIDGYGKRVFAMSPFLTASAIARAKRLGTERWELVGREDQLAALAPNATVGWECHLVSDDAVTGDVADDVETQASVDVAPTPRGLHAKVLVVENFVGGVWWWLGSANLSDAAWSGLNVELMVELRATVAHAGIDRFLDSGIRKILVPWTASEGEREAPDSTLEHMLDHARAALFAASLAMTCTGASEPWSVTLHGDFVLPAGVTAQVWPLSLPEALASREVERSASSQHLDITWQSVATVSLTAMLGVSLTARSGNATESIRFAARVRTEGFPEDRDAHLLRSILANSEGLLRLLQMILAGANGDMSALVNDADDGTGLGAQLLGGGTGAVLLESIMRTLSRHPDKLRGFDNVLLELEKTEAQLGSIVPDDLRALWATIRASGALQR